MYTYVYKYIYIYIYLFIYLLLFDFFCLKSTFSIYNIYIYLYNIIYYLMYLYLFLLISQKIVYSIEYLAIESNTIDSIRRNLQYSHLYQNTLHGHSNCIYMYIYIQYTIDCTIVHAWTTLQCLHYQYPIQFRNSRNNISNSISSRRENVNLLIMRQKEGDNEPKKREQKENE